MFSTIKAALPAPAIRALRPVLWALHISQDWWGTMVWTRTREVTTPLGFKLSSGFHPAYAQMRNGTFEVDETAIIARTLDDVDLFVDVGANLGYYSLLALKKGKPVVAFEPQPRNLRSLFQNLIANGWEDRAEVFPLALSDKPGLLTLYGASGPSASLVKNWAGYSSRHRQVVPVSTLDRVLDQRFPGQRLLIKIDVEGAEHQVLKGATLTLCRNPQPIWLLEVCLQDFHPGGANPDFEAIFDLFWSHGYQAFTASEPPRAVSPSDVRDWAAAGRSDSKTINYVFAARALEPSQPAKARRRRLNT